VVAVQEPGLNPYLKIPKHTRGGDYHIVWGGGRAVLYVQKRHSVAVWTWKANEDWCSVMFGEGQSAITIYSIYSEGYKGSGWHTPIHELTLQEPDGRNILVGDFNLHHLLWDEHERYQPQAEALLALAERWNLSLATPKGEVMCKRFGFRSSTIDHV
jgi:Endonuclease-reverse transcriptase